MNKTTFEMPVNGWNGLHASQYIVQCYTLRFVPTLEFVEELNSDVPRGLRYELGVLNGRGAGGVEPGRIIVYSTEPGWFELYAEPTLNKAEELVALVLKQHEVEKWIAQ